MKRIKKTAIKWIQATSWMLLMSTPLHAGFKVESDGLKLSVAPFDVGGVRFDGGDLLAFPDIDQSLVLNLHTNTLHLLRRSIGDESLLIANISTNDEVVDEIKLAEPKLPSTRIPNTLESIKNGTPIRVHCFGSSLVAAGRASYGWEQILFSEKYAGDRYSVLNAKAPDAIESKNYGVGGTNSRYSIALFGEGLKGGESYATSAYDCDLAIVALLPNGGVDRLSVFEGVVRELRVRGIEVLLLTDNSFADQGIASGLWGDGGFVKQLADTYGCGIADTAAYMLEGQMLGEKVYADSIHSAELGHRRWALAASGALQSLEGLEVDAFSVDTSLPTIKSVLEVPQRILVDFRPKGQGGKWQEPAGGNGVARAYGMDPPGSLIMEAGDSILLDQNDYIAADLIFAADSGFVAEVVSLTSGEKLRMVDYKAPNGVGPRPQVRDVIAASKHEKPTMAEQYEVKVTSGKLRLYGLSYHFN